MRLLRKRNQELLALFLSFILLFLGLGLSELNLFSKISLKLFYPAIFLSFLFIAAHLSLRLFFPQSDPFFLPLGSFLTALSLIMIYRLKPELLKFQVLAISLGLLSLVLTLFLLKDYRRLKNYKYLVAFLGIFLLLSPIFFGVERGGAKLWLSFRFFSFQPAEAAKILLTIFFAAYLQEKKEVLAIGTKKFLKVWWPSLKHLGPLVVMWLVSLLILIFEKDLGTSILFFGLFLGLIYLATARISYELIGVLFFLVGATFSFFLFSHVKIRISSWLNPWADLKGSGYQIVQSLFAIGSGGLSGSGLNKGYPLLIPAVHTDFIFAALAEELGLLGGAALLSGYLLFTYRGLKLSLETEDEFGKLLVAGLSLVFGLQTVVIIGGVTKLLPLTGVTLPFLSYGGSSLIINFILIGILLSVSNQNARRKVGAKDG